jgi:hypothetical protein
MNKLDVNFSELDLAPASFSTPQTARRLIVLLPESEVDTALTARKIWELANALESRVQFIGLSKDAAHEPGLRRQIVNLSAMVGDGNNICVESKIELGNNWLSVVKSEWQEGDVIACFAEQRSGFAHRPLSQILESNLKSTVYIFTGLHQEERNSVDRIHSDHPRFLLAAIKTRSIPHRLGTHSVTLHFALCRSWIDLGVEQPTRQKHWKIIYQVGNYD